jgi:hypothetical protein
MFNFKSLAYSILKFWHGRCYYKNVQTDQKDKKNV